MDDGDSAVRSADRAGAAPGDDGSAMPLPETVIYGGSQLMQGSVALPFVILFKLAIRLPIDLTESLEREDLGKYMLVAVFPLLVLVTGHLVQMLWRLQ